MAEVQICQRGGRGKRGFEKLPPSRPRMSQVWVGFTSFGGAKWEFLGETHLRHRAHPLRKRPPNRGRTLSLRKKIADSVWFNQAVEGLFAAYIRFAYRSSRWERSGFEEMDETLRSGTPVIVALWHQRLMMAPFLFDTSLGKVCTLTSSGRAGRMGGQIVARFGLETIAMSSHKRHIALSREVLGKMRDGYSIGIATDGPRGPARVASTVPLIWARASGAPVFVVSFSARRVIAFPTWDKMWLPAPWTRGVLMCRKWDQDVPRKSSEEETEALRQKLEIALDEVTDLTDRSVGRAIDKG